MNKIKYAMFFPLFMFASLFCMEQKDDEFRWGKGLICKEFLSYLTQLKELIAMQIPCEYAPKSLDDVLKDILKNKKLDKNWELKRTLIATAVEAGASANTQTRYTNPLHMATEGVGALRGDYYLSKFLLKHGADPNIGEYGKDERYGKKPLSTCALDNRYNLAELLLKYGANPNIKFRLGPLLNSVETVKMAKILLSYGADHSCMTLSNNNLLHSAAMGNTHEPELVTLWLEKGFDPSAVDSSNWTPLHQLMLQHNLMIWDNSKDNFETKARLLLKAGARLDIRNKWGDTPIDVAKRELSDKQYNRFLEIIKEVEQEKEK